MTMRVGHGYDVHRLVTDRKLILGGVEIPYSMGLSGHSDADVLTHALMDALLGAAGMGDIGQLFPDSDEKYRGISSLLLLKQVGKALAAEGWHLGNGDMTVIAQRPKLMPYLSQMAENLADTLGVDASCFNIKATTEEKLGFTGQGLGIAAHAVVLIER